MENQDLFYCYSARLRRFIRDNGDRWIDKGIHRESNKPYWVFKRSTKLDRLIEEYKRIR